MSGLRLIQGKNSKARLEVVLINTVVLLLQQLLQL